MRNKFIPKPGADQIVQSAKRGARAIAELPILEAHKKELISILIWKITEAHGKLTTRFQSEGALLGTGGKRQHEHVFPRKQLVERILAHPENTDEILESAIGCVVSESEHRLLSHSTPTSTELDGWERYRRAGVRVRDLAGDGEVWIT